MDEREFMTRMDRHQVTLGEHMRESNELMARVDASMERVDASMARVDASLGRVDASLERVDASLERNTQAFVDLRSFLGQTTDVLAALVREVGAGREAFVEETRAQRQALFAILDQLQRGSRPGDAPA